MPNLMRVNIIFKNLYAMLCCFAQAQKFYEFLPKVQSVLFKVDSIN